jgi:hypothetical protein
MLCTLGSLECGSLRHVCLTSTPMRPATPVCRDIPATPPAATPTSLGFYDTPISAHHCPVLCCSSDLCLYKLLAGCAPPADPPALALPASLHLCPLLHPLARQYYMYVPQHTAPSLVCSARQVPALIKQATSDQAGMRAGGLHLGTAKQRLWFPQPNASLVTSYFLASSPGPRVFQTP